MIVGDSYCLYCQRTTAQRGKKLIYSNLCPECLKWKAADAKWYVACMWLYLR